MTLKIALADISRIFNYLITSLYYIIMVNILEDEMKTKIYQYKLPNGDIYLYGGNLEKCLPYIDTVVNSVEDACDYCSKHNIRIFHNPNRGLKGFIEMLRIYRLTKMYGVHSSVKEMDEYLKSLGV